MEQNKENISSEYQEAQEKFYEANVVGNMTFKGDDNNGQ